MLTGEQIISAIELSLEWAELCILKWQQLQRQGKAFAICSHLHSWITVSRISFTCWRQKVIYSTYWDVLGCFIKESLPRILSIRMHIPKSEGAHLPCLFLGAPGILGMIWKCFGGQCGIFLSPYKPVAPDQSHPAKLSESLHTEHTGWPAELEMSWVDTVSNNVPNRPWQFWLEMCWLWLGRAIVRSPREASYGEEAGMGSGKQSGPWSP